MSMYVQGIKLPDDRWIQMKAVYDACVAADVDVPDIVCEYFADNVPDENGVVVDISTKEWEDADRSGILVDLSLLPQDVTMLRIVHLRT